MKRKAQAGMEFLMTYGWAILLAIIAIGILAYFGVFEKGKYAEETQTPLTVTQFCAVENLSYVSVGGLFTYCYKIDEEGYANVYPIIYINKTYYFVK